MKTTGTIFVMVFCLLVMPANFAEAGPMGTAFTYQGHLYDANYTASGLYDFAFKLYDANAGGNKVGTDVNVADIDVIDGYFTVELDFGGSVFGGSARWLEIGVRQGDLDDPNGYATLSPRQEVTPAPYAIYAKNAQTANSDNDWSGAGTGRMYTTNLSDNVGIGVTNPIAKLEVGGSTDLRSQIRSIRTSGATAMFGGGQTEGVVGTYSNHPFVISTNLSERVRVDTAGNVGIGTTTPTQMLDVDGKARIAGDLYLEGILNLNDSSNTTYIQNVGDGLKFWVDTLGTPIAFDFQVTDDSYMTILNSGEVGVGTTSPGCKLDVDGSARVTDGLNRSTDLKIATDDGAEIAVGYDIIQFDRKLYVYTDSDVYGVFCQNEDTSGNRYSIYGYGEGDTEGNSYAVFGRSMNAIGNNYGVYGWATNPSSGDNFGVYGRALNAGTGEAYAGYFDGNVFASGDVGIGISNPARKLHVSDTMRLEPRATAPSSPSEGDMYMSSTTHKLMVYDGTTWQACW